MLILIHDLASYRRLLFLLVKNYVHAMRVIDELGNLILSRTCFP